MTPSLAESASAQGQRAPYAGRTSLSGDLGLVSGLRSVRAVVFDTDGVITDSARVHAAAWKVAFDACLRDFPPPDPADRRPFDIREDYRHHVDGNEAARLRLPGKPAPALFLEAARRLGTGAAETAVVEDALAGVEAGRFGGLGLVVGVDRTAGPTSTADLREHGADLVIRGLAELVGSPPAPGTGTTPAHRTPSTDPAEG
jgi:beta-phosphoglucomutase-like phosphatase (HAD superfamily)